MTERPPRTMEIPPPPPLAKGGVGGFGIYFLGKTIKNYLFLYQVMLFLIPIIKRKTFFLILFDAQTHYLR